MLIGGSPCQGFSRNGKCLNFDDPRSKLFFDYVKILEWLKKNNNCDIRFLLENVEMKKEWRNVISEYLNADYKLINSKLVSAQNRPRLYWTNFDFDIPNDKNILLIDILEDVDIKNYITYKNLKIDPQISKKCYELIDVVDGEVRIRQATKQGYIVANSGDGINLQFPTSKTRRGRVIKGKSNTLDCSCDVCVYVDGVIRKFTINELERLQTLPDGYTNGLSEKKRIKAIGNGWTKDVITEIFKQLKF